MPLNTAIPIERRALAPAPVANTSGTTPRIKANEVMRIGRKRSRAASTAASTISMPSARFSRAYSTIKIAFLLANAISRMRPIWVKVVRNPKQNQRADGAEQRKRDREDDRDWLEPAFV